MENKLTNLYGVIYSIESEAKCLAGLFKEADMKKLSANKDWGLTAIKSLKSDLDKFQTFLENID